MDIASRFADKGVLEYALALASKIWRFRSWPGSRWATIGASGRTLVGRALMGLDGLVRFSSESTSASMYHLSGYVRHCSPLVMELSALVGTSYSPSDNALMALAADYRVAKHLSELEAPFDEGLEKTESIGFEVWSLIADASGLSAHKLPRRAIAAAQSSAS